MEIGLVAVTHGHHTFMQLVTADCVDLIIVNEYFFSLSMVLLAGVQEVSFIRT